MLAPDLPLNEDQRLQALRDLHILDTAPEERFDRLVRTARALFKTPIVLISLIDANRQWFKSCIGLEVDSTPRDISFCGHAILHDDILHIPDALADNRFADNPLVTGAPHIRFYAGAPLRTGGHRIGTLCLIDRNPRRLSDEERGQLRDIADAIEHQFTLQDAFEAARQINRHQLRLDAVFRTVPDGLLIIDDQGVISSANPAAGQLFGCPPEQLRQQAALHLFTPPSQPEFSTQIERLGTDGCPGRISFEIRGLRGNGESFPLELTVSRMPIDDTSMLTVIARDITTRKSAEEKLHELRRRQEAILDSAAAAIVSTDANGIIQTFSKGAEQMFGYAADEVIGIHTTAILHDPGETLERTSELSRELNTEVPPGFRTYTQKVRLGDAPTQTEWLYMRKDGTRFYGEVTISAIPQEHGGLGGFIGIVNDITERKQLEKMKDEFVSTVSHELRTPLTSIRGALGLVLGKAADSLTPKARQLLETASRNAERLTLLINDILDLEKIASGRMEFAMRPIDIVALTRQALQAHEGYAAQHRVRLQLGVCPPSLTVSADENRLMQVYANLLSNAIKYSPADGAVNIAVTEHEGRVRVSIRDHGRGIPAAFRQTAFQRFAQADSSDTREKGGTGLGLSIVKAIIDRHAGHVDYESAPGEGTLFYFELPLPPASGGVMFGVRSRVLICEDNPDVAGILAAILAEEGIPSDVVGTATDAAARVAASPYSALLLDLTLPDRDGLLLLAELRADPATRELPVIIVTGRADEDQGWRGEGMYVLDWLQKPVDRERLAAALHRVIPPDSRARILHVEDEPDILQITRMLVEDLADYDHASRLSEARGKLRENRYDLVLLDITLPDGNGLDLLDQIPPGSRILVFSGQEPTGQMSQQVAAALTKSRTSNEFLRDTIKNLLQK
ncbi:PAS domain S-box-containing protein [Fluviicoccus keumensis]|uniref:histidine kinase n=1 Tax=Fluviicoccus keumensis TaxID=1435465 RepID=A0A4Q7ZC15_9GAMM|nr:PAS domain S-box protein [Fluviicoccus keumensis]RZU47671.1 PAS domain S-box-containing protein [Fluviicoccus keumensis]